MADSGTVDLVLEYIESVWNDGDPDALARLTAPGFRYYLAGQQGRGRREMKAFIELLRRAFPDWRVTVVAVVGENDEVAVRWTGTATHEGEFRGIPATGSRIETTGINMYRVEDGRIAAEWEQMDSLGMLRQMGVGE